MLVINVINYLQCNISIVIYFYSFDAYCESRQVNFENLDLSSVNIMCYDVLVIATVVFADSIFLGILD